MKLSQRMSTRPSTLLTSLPPVAAFSRESLRQIKRLIYRRMSAVRYCKRLSCQNGLMVWENHKSRNINAYFLWRYADLSPEKIATLLNIRYGVSRLLRDGARHELKVLAEQPQA